MRALACYCLIGLLCLAGCNSADPDSTAPECDLNDVQVGARCERSSCNPPFGYSPGGSKPLRECCPAGAEPGAADSGCYNLVGDCSGDGMPCNLPEGPGVTTDEWGNSLATANNTEVLPLP